MWFILLWALVGGFFGAVLRRVLRPEERDEEILFDDFPIVRCPHCGEFHEYEPPRGCESLVNIEDLQECHRIA